MEAREGSEAVSVAKESRRSGVMMERLMVLCEAEKERRAEPSGTVR